MTSENDNEQTKIDIAVINTKLDTLTQHIEQLTRQVNVSNDSKVSRNEWEQRNHYVDGRFQALGREISELRIDIKTEKTNKPHWTAIVGAIVVVVVLGLDIISRYVSV
jgi:flagellar biosynthesis chaperone FliJ